MSPHVEATLVLFFAFIIDLIIGDPQYKWHPVRMIGMGIASCLKILKRIGLKGRGAGVLLTLNMIFVSVAGYTLIHFALLMAHPLASFSFNLFICYSFLALRDLFNHIKPVTKSLESNDLYGARKAISMVVGRDANSLDNAGITRAAIETMAENFVDGFLSPVFWYAAGSITGTLTGVQPAFIGISFMIIFKTASTLDSMVGYKNEEFIKIGWAGARLDDVMNFIPARLSMINFFIGSWLTRLKPVDGIKITMRDRLKHDSPNSAHAESFVAGALNVRLGGPTKYPEGIKDKPWLGGEYPDPGIRHIAMTMKLLSISSWAVVISGCLMVLILWHR
jgi:adenosylcobinamide-phosphate synthase